MVAGRELPSLVLLHVSGVCFFFLFPFLKRMLAGDFDSSVPMVLLRLKLGGSWIEGLYSPLRVRSTAIFAYWGQKIISPHGSIGKECVGFLPSSVRWGGGAGGSSGHLPGISYILTTPTAAGSCVIPLIYLLQIRLLCLVLCYG